MDHVCVHCGDAKLQLVWSDCCDSSSDAPGILLSDNCLWLDKRQIRILSYRLLQSCLVSRQPDDRHTGTNVPN